MHCFSNNQFSYEVNWFFTDLPRITMKSEYQGYANQDLVLYCFVDSAVPFTVTWSNGDNPLDSPTNYVKSVNSSLWITPKAFSAGDKYTCSARNIAGVTSKTTRVTVKGKRTLLILK